MELRRHAERLSGCALRELAQARRDRIVEAGSWRLFLARQRLDSAAEQALTREALHRGLPGAIDELFASARINHSEDRAALHWALRAAPEQVSGAAARVRNTLDAALALAMRVRSGQRRAGGGAAFDAILHVGIGGSDWGPRLLLDAFEPDRERRFAVRFCSGLDPSDWRRAVDGLDPGSTLVVGSSKSFSTEETLSNLARAKDWLQPVLGRRWSANLALVTAREARAAAWLNGEEGADILGLPEEVGGRYSVWSAVSLVAMIALGPDLFAEFLAGARRIDAHVRRAAPERNPALLLATLDYWNATMHGATMRAVLAYPRALRLLPVWLQQLEMESNGKSTTTDGAPVRESTTPAVWGGEGVPAQHTFCQWLHQGTLAIPVEFLVEARGSAAAGQLSPLLYHALAQAEILCNGHVPDDPDMAGHRRHAGGRPSTILCVEKLTPATFGELLALYEHRTYLAGRMWRVNSFDQWGVEHGKSIARALRDGEGVDAVTAGMLDRLAEP